MQKLSLRLFNSFAYQYVNWLMIALLLLLQGVIWQPILSSQWAQFEVLERKQSKVLAVQHQEKNILTTLAAQPLKHYDWLETNLLPQSWRWRLRGAASLEHWQAALANAYDITSLQLLSVTWQRRPHNKWYADFFYQLVAVDSTPSLAAPLPKLISQHREGVIKMPWQLVSIVSLSGKTMALLHLAEQHYWVTNGSWLPDVGVYVEAVTSQYVSLMDQSGQKRELNVLDRGSVK